MSTNGIYTGFRNVDSKPMSYKGDRHVLIVGPNGSGKSKRLGLPNLLRSAGRSWVVVAPKGELLHDSIEVRRQVGDVIILDPYNIAGHGSHGFNPLLGLDPRSEMFDTDVALLAESIITVEGKEPYFTQSARVLVAMLIMLVVKEAFQRGTVPHLADVRRLLGEPSGSGYDDDDDSAEPKLYGIPALALEAAKSTFEGLRNKAGQFSNWSREVKSIVSSAQVQTDCFDDFPISRDMQAGEYDFRNLARRVQTVYLILPVDMLERHKRWLRLALSSAIISCLRADTKKRYMESRELALYGGRQWEPGQGFDQPATGRYPVAIFMDEFASLGHLPLIENVWAVVRGFGLQLIPVVQDLAQLKKIYGDRWPSFVGNTGAACFFRPGEDTTAGWMEKRLGEKTVMIPGYSISQTMGGQNAGVSSTVGYTPQRMPVKSAYELYGMQDGELYAFLSGVSAGVPAFAPWWEEVQWKNPALSGRGPGIEGGLDAGAGSPLGGWVRAVRRFLSGSEG